MKKLNTLILFSLIFITACSTLGPTNENSFKIMMISEVPINYQESFGYYVEELLENRGLDDKELEIDVEIFPVSHDKLTIEIVNRDVDVFIVDETLKHILLDPYGLFPLDELKENIPENIDFEELILEDDSTGDYHLYAVPLANDSTLVRDMGLILPSKMLGAVTSTSAHQEIGVYLLGEFQ